MAVDDDDPLAQLDRAAKFSRQQNQAILDGQVGAMSAAVLNFGASMLARAILHPGGEIENTSEVAVPGNP